MAVHAVVNEAGSAGKTTTAVTLAAILAESGRRTLLWDNDAQGNATLFVGVQAVPGKTAAEVLVGERSLDEVIVPTIVDRLFVVPADRSLNGALIQLTRDFGGEQRIRVALETVAGQYDAVIIDCPGAASVLTIAALAGRPQERGRRDAWLGRLGVDNRRCGDPHRAQLVVGRAGAWLSAAPAGQGRAHSHAMGGRPLGGQWLVVG